MERVSPWDRQTYVTTAATFKYPGLLSGTLEENSELAKTVRVLFPDDVCDVGNWNRFGDVAVQSTPAAGKAPREHQDAKGFEAQSQARKNEKPSHGESPKWMAQRRRSVLMRSGMDNSFCTKKTQPHDPEFDSGIETQETVSSKSQRPLVSILIPAFNAQPWIADTLHSTIAQTWEPKEIIVVDDGSTDQTVTIAKQFESKGVRVYTKHNEGAASTRNMAYRLSKGDYIQWLDADDLLAPDKIALQLNARRPNESKRVLFSSAWGKFIYRHYRAKFAPTDLWCDLSPLEWLLRKMGQNLWMQTATWLVSRELTEAAGPWDRRLLSDDDGEYFCRVLLASECIRFVPEAKVYYRGPGLAFGSLSYIGRSARKLEAHWLSMRLHIGYLRSLEDSERVREACLNYLRASQIHFYSERLGIVEQAQDLARDLGGELAPPRLSWKYSWVKAAFGWHLAKSARQNLLRFR